MSNNSGLDNPISNPDLAQLSLFLRYLKDDGIQAHLAIAIARQLGNSSELVRAIMQAALEDLTGGESTLNSAIAAAPSLHLLANYARQVDQSVFPIYAIPSDETVQACLRGFHSNLTPAASND